MMERQEVLTLKISIIGLGAVTRNIHLPAYEQLKDRIEIAGGCDPDPAAREWFKNRVPGSAVFDSPDEMIKQTKPDIVCICTPPDFHKDLCYLALESQAHVFCEKPFMSNLRDADDVIAKADNVGRWVVVNNQFKKMAIHKKSKEMIGSKEFGKLLFIHASQTFIPTDKTETGWRQGLEERVCFEFGIHVFDLIRFYFDMEPARIYAHIPKPDPSIKADLINVISVEFPDGRAASVLLDRMSKGPENYLDMRLDGEYAAIENSIGGKLEFTAGLHTKERKPFTNIQFAMGAQAKIRQRNKSRVIAKDPMNPFMTSTRDHFAQFLDAIANGTTPDTTAADNRNTLAMVFAAYQSARTGLPVNLAELSSSNK